MSNYSTLDAHSRNCSACILQREKMGSGSGEPRKHSHHTISHTNTLDRKKTSLPGEKRKLSASNSSLIQRSNSCLSSASMGTSFREETGEGAVAAYLTPTQRKNQEIKTLRLELEKAKNQLMSRDKEIVILKKEVEALKESQNPSSLNDSWLADSESAADSGNCEEMVTSWGPGAGHQEAEEVPEMAPGIKMDNIDFELMETALREEEEYRHRLEDSNQELQDTVSDLKEEIQRVKDGHFEEVARLKSSHSENICDAKKESHQKIEELIIELAESSMRCARQQDTIEQRQLKIDELLKENNINKEDISKLQEMISETKTKEEPRTKDKEEEYLSNVSHVETVSSQTQTELCKSVSAITQTDDHLNMSKGGEFRTGDGSEAGLINQEELQTKSEATCDNKIHYTYQFLRRSIYYYITDKDNRAYHLKSIQRLLEFSEAELSTIHHTRAHQTQPIAPIKRY